MFVTVFVLLEHRTASLSDKPYKTYDGSHLISFNLIQAVRHISLSICFTSDHFEVNRIRRLELKPEVYYL